MIWSCIIELLDAGLDWDAVRKSKRLRFLSQQVSKRRSLNEIFSIGWADSCPLVRHQNGAAARIYDCRSSPVRVYKAVSWKLVDILAGTFSRLWEESALVSRLKVVCNMKEGSSFECISKLPCLCISRDQPGEPVIGNAHRGYDFSFAAEFKAPFSEYS
jgi:hypothetical protein